MKTLIISDFSKTFTDPSCSTTWSVFAKSGLLGSEYTAERNRLYGEYHDFELAGDLEKTKEWWGKHGELFVTYGLTKELISRIVADEKYFKPRLGLSEFFKFIQENNISLHIVSSGISQFIEEFLRIHNAPEGIVVYGNELQLKDSQVVGFDHSSIITTLNKQDGLISTNTDCDKIVLLGDDETDLAMYK
jgi:HAD superfamily phosphoserine phosphatase-like hydrolase